MSQQISHIISKCIFRSVIIYLRIYFKYVHATAPPMTAPTITEATLLSTTSFTVSWTITDPDHNYIITWINLHTSMVKGSMTVSENTNSYTVTGLNGIDNYNVSVSANNSCGMMMSDPITVYGKNVQYIYVRRFIYSQSIRMYMYITIV